MVTSFNWEMGLGHLVATTAYFDALGRVLTQVDGNFRSKSSKIEFPMITVRGASVPKGTSVAGHEGPIPAERQPDLV